MSLLAGLLRGGVTPRQTQGPRSSAALCFSASASRLTPRNRSRLDVSQLYRLLLPLSSVPFSDASGRSVYSTVARPAPTTASTTSRAGL